MTKKNEYVLKLKELCSKYDYLGLNVTIEFNRHGVVFHGYWSAVSNNCVNDVLLSFNKIYEYDLLKSYKLEDLLDLFKEEFGYEKEKKLRQAESEDKNDDKT